MAYYRDLREYIEVLEACGKLTRIRRPINKDTELYPLAKLPYRGLPEKERKAFLFENVTDSLGRKYGMPVLVGALAASSDIVAIGLKCRVEDISEKLSDAELHPLPAKVVQKADVQEEVHVGDSLLEHGGLCEFPIPIATPGYDPAPYITAPYVVTKDPDTGIPNVGMYRAMLKAPLRTGMNFATPGRGGFIHFRKYQARGKPCPAAIVVGGTPNMGYASVTPYPVDVSEFAVAGAMAGEPMELVRCETIDLEVPVNADIVIEGEISTTEEEPEAPFGEAVGFIGLMDINPFFTVTCITHRRNPVWLGTISQYPPSESSKIRQCTTEGTLYKYLRHTMGMKAVLGVSLLEGGPLVLKLDKVDQSEVWHALEAAAARAAGGKMVIAVDQDVNFRDIESVNLAIGVRTQPHRDYRTVQKVAQRLGDYSLDTLDRLEEMDTPTYQGKRPITSNLLINATLKWPYPPLSLPARQFMEGALDIWREEGLADLNLKEPWWGIDLGYWSEDHTLHARAAVQGQHFKAGEDYAARRRRVGNP